MKVCALFGIVVAVLLTGVADAREGLSPAQALAQQRSSGPTPSTRDPVGPPEVLYDPAGLPPPVRRMREQILEAARTGDPEQLRPVIESSEMPPSFTLDTAQARDPIEVLKDALEDKGGQEILATLIEILEAGFVHVDVGTPQEMWVWPYFTHMPLDKLTPEQKVELFRIVTAFDYEQMLQVGTYIFYRVGIGPDGTWHYFVAGE